MDSIEVRSAYGSRHRVPTRLRTAVVRLGTRANGWNEDGPATVTVLETPKTDRIRRRDIHGAGMRGQHANLCVAQRLVMVRVHGETRPRPIAIERFEEVGQ